MAYEDPSPSGERKVDSLAEMVNVYYKQAKEYRVEDELIWRDAHDAHRAVHPESVDRVVSLAKRRGIFIHLVRRRVNSARVKISSLLFESGKIPFSITPNKNPKFLPPDLMQLDPMMAAEEVILRSERMEGRIRDLLRKSDYVNVVNDCIFEMTLYGTGVTKSIVLKNYDYPVYRTIIDDPMLKQAESVLENELIPTVEKVSIWDIIPTPEAKSVDDCEWIIQRAYYSSQRLRVLGESQIGFDRDAIEEVIADESGSDPGADQSDSPFRYMKRRSERVKKHMVLEMWGVLPV